VEAVPLAAPVLMSQPVAPAVAPRVLPVAAPLAAPVTSDPFDCLHSNEPSPPRPASVPRDRLKAVAARLGPRGMVIGLGAAAGLSLLLILLVIWWGLSGSSKPVAPQGALETGKTHPPSTEPTADGSLPAGVLQRVKDATVYVGITSANGSSEGSGSGFYELDSGMIVTNAHVIDMLDPDSPPPARIEIVFFKGTPRQVRVEGTVAGVERESDLAFIRFGPADFHGPAPGRLQVGTAQGLRETQKVFFAGFPFGDELGKEISVNPATVSSKRSGGDGVLKEIQLNGDMHPGNSGGPVVDARGNVVGVCVAGIRKTQINFAIPGDAILRLYQGHIHAVEIEDSVLRGSGVGVPLIFTTLDPKNNIRKIDCDWWLDDPDREVPASAIRPALPPGASARQTRHVVSNPKSSPLRSEIVLDALPPPGKVLYVQPVLVNGQGKVSWLAARAVTVQSPLRAQSVNIQKNRPVGQAPLQLVCTSSSHLARSGKEKTSSQTRITAQLTEETRPMTFLGAPVRCMVHKLDVEESEDGRAQAPSAALRVALEHAGKLVLSAYRDKEGSLSGKTSRAGSMPAQGKERLEGLGDGLLQALDALAVQVPLGQLTVGQTWHARRSLPPLEFPGAPGLLAPVLARLKGGALEVTYTYLGLRTHEGREAAVISLEGRSGSDGPVGQLRGKALVDPTTGQVLQAQASALTTLELTRDDVSLRLKTRLEARVTRGALVPPG
jgi:S1-C subfamily serine protease